MKMTLITVSGPDYHPNHRLAQAAQEKGHDLRILHPYTIWAALQGGQAGLAGPLNLADLGVVAPRMGATLSDYSLNLVRHLEMLGAPMINNAHSITLARHKFLCVQALAAAGLPVPDSVMVNSAEGLDTAADYLGGWPLVLKEVQSRQGSGVFLAESRSQAMDILEQHLEPRSGLLVQQYMPPQGRRDRRVFVLGNRAVVAMDLTPPPGDFRSNVHQGGQGELATMTPELEKMSVQAAKALGLLIAGVDVILDNDDKPHFIEVNYTPGFRGLEEVTGRDIAGEMIDFMADPGNWEG
jgi:ribosomal protein S6--L-glutamate ligase